MALTIFSQQDKRWRDKYLGKSSCKMGPWGCTTTDITTARNWCYNSKITPGEVVDLLDYTDKKRYPKLDEGLILWYSLKKIGMKLVSRIRRKDERAINKALAHPTQVCLIEVNWGAHWLFLIGKKTKKGYRVMDPLYGDICYTNRYKGNITGCAVLDKK